MTTLNRWTFSKHQLQNTPSRKHGISYGKEMGYRQQSASFIQQVGRCLEVNQLCINTAIVYLHRFYMFHSFAMFDKHDVSVGAIFLAAKTEEQPRRTERIIRAANLVLHKKDRVDTSSEWYTEEKEKVVDTENILLQTLGFDMVVDHPHAHLLKCCQMRGWSKDMTKMCYSLATNSLQLTTMCLEYKPTTVACVCINLVTKWCRYDVAADQNGKPWYHSVDKLITGKLLDKLTAEFMDQIKKSPSKLKNSIIPKWIHDAGSSSKSIDHSSSEQPPVPLGYLAHEKLDEGIVVPVDGAQSFISDDHWQLCFTASILLIVSCVVLLHLDADSPSLKDHPPAKKIKIEPVNPTESQGYSADCSQCVFRWMPPQEIPFHPPSTMNPPFDPQGYAVNYPVAVPPPVLNTSFSEYTGPFGWYYYQLPPIPPPPLPPLPPLPTLPPPLPPPPPPPPLLPPPPPPPE